MKIHYIVSVYIGERLTQSVNRLIKKDPYHYIKKHLECLKKFKVPDIAKVTFVISKNNQKIDEGAKKIVQEHKIGANVEVILRENFGMSYSAWNEVISNSIDKNEEYDYFFLIEDDYVPNVDYFYQYFVDVCTPKTFFVAQKYMNFDTNPHPAISNGLLSYEQAKNAKQNFGSVFKTDSSNSDYNTGIQNQINYLKNGQTLGCEFPDVEKTTFIPFLDRTHYSFYGSADKPIVLIPECDLDWEIAYRDQLIGFRFRSAAEVSSNGLKRDQASGMIIRKANEIDANNPLYSIFGRLRKIRSYYEHRKDPQKFTDEESNAFYLNNLDKLFILYEDDFVDVAGYCMIKQINEKLFISPKISFHYSKGDSSHLTKLAIFISWYCDEHAVKKLYCEVTKTNDKLIRQLTSLGFFMESTNDNTSIYKYVHP